LQRLFHLVELERLDDGLDLFHGAPFVLCPPQKLSIARTGFAQPARRKQWGSSSSRASLRCGEKMLGFHSIIGRCAENKLSVGDLAAFRTGIMIKNYADKRIRSA
jgi:hypothetical protein